MLTAIVTPEELGVLTSDEQKHYSAKTEGKHFLEVTSADGWALEDTGALKKGLEVERKTSADRLKKLKAFDGIDATAAREALGKMEEIANWNPDEKAAEAREAFEKQLTEKFAKDRAGMVKKHSEEMEVGTKQRTGMRTQLEGALIGAAANAAIADNKGSSALLLPTIKGLSRLVESEDGDLVVRVVGEGGVERLSTKAGCTDPMTIAELVAEMRASEVYARAFDGTGASGSGAAGSDGGVKSGAGGTVSIASSIAATDHAAYRAAKATAAKDGKALVMTDD